MTKEMNTTAWEFETDDQALLALAGITTDEAYRKDRLGRADDVRGICTIQPDDRGFEIGSGDGTVARLLAPDCAFLDCADVSVSFLARAREHCRDVPNVAFHQVASGSLESLASSRYDFGYSLNVFIHLNPYDILLYLREVRRLLKPGGRFYFDACTIGSDTRELFHEHATLYQREPRHLRGLLSFNHPRLIRAVVADVGLEVDEAKSRTNDQGGWLGFLVRSLAPGPTNERRAAS
jgi:SAM-dependent methyltransferase